MTDLNKLLTPLFLNENEIRKAIELIFFSYRDFTAGPDKILEKIYQHQARLDLTCRFRWTENAVAIWDNRSVQHYAISDFFPGRGLGYERIMDRIAIEGDRPN